MIIDINNVDEELSSLIQSLIDGQNESIYITKDGKYVAKLSLIDQKSARIGVAKKEMNGFDVSMDSFDKIPIDDFDIN